MLTKLPYEKVFAWNFIQVCEMIWNMKWHYRNYVGRNPKVKDISHCKNNSWDFWRAIWIGSGYDHISNNIEYKNISVPKQQRVWILSFENFQS